MKRTAICAWWKLISTCTRVITVTTPREQQRVIATFIRIKQTRIAAWKQSIICRSPKASMTLWLSVVPSVLHMNMSIRLSIMFRPTWNIKNIIAKKLLWLKWPQRGQYYYYRTSQPLFPKKRHQSAITLFGVLRHNFPDQKTTDI